MATLWIREYADLGADRTRTDYGKVLRSERAPMAAEPGVDQTPLTFSTTAASAAFGTTTGYIAMISDVKFHYVVGTNPTATTNALPVPADTLVFIGVAPGQKVAAIAAA